MAGKHKELFERYKRDLRPENLDDLIVLKEPTDYNITEILKNRYKEDGIYTYLGSTLISVNPYKKTTHYSSDVVNYFHNQKPYSVAPHLYSLAEDAFRTMKETGIGQVIIISGESGSGKTEAARLMMDFLAKVSISGLLTENIKRIVLGSNDVLEAFGNAKTLRNDNSSRFGKYIDMFYNFKGHMEGAHITTSLLEKQRVVAQREGERNFHIFYQLCDGADDQMRKQLGLEAPKKFKYLVQKTGADTSIKGVSDKDQFKVTISSMTEAGISITERMEIFKILAGVLHLGNVEFKDEMINNKEAASIVNAETSFKLACQCLGVEQKLLADCITTRKMRVGREVTTMTQTAAKCSFNRDALAKGIYERLFQWLIRRINAAVKRPDDAKFSIGLLDLYGFEIYEKPDVNSLEQLNINFVNERVQDQIQKWLVNEQHEYVNEDVPWKFKNFDVNAVEECIRVIDGKPIGIYSLLDEEALFPKGTDDNFLNKVNEAFHEKTTAFEKSRFKGKNFYLNHFASKVMYDVTDWVEKNRDTLYDDMILTMRWSQSDLIKQLFPREEKLGGNRLQQTTSQTFQSDVRGLIGKLANKKHLYVKCIKPNHNKKGDDFNEEIVMDQVKYLGLSGNVFVRKQGYHFKMPYEEFLDRYKLCCDTTWPTWKGTAKSGTQEILKHMNIPKHMYALGKSKVYLRTPIQLAALDEKIEGRKTEMATLIQKSYRRFKTRQAAMASQHLTRALQMTFNEKGEFSFKQTMNLINTQAERERRMVVVSKEAVYLMDPKTYTVIRRMPFSKMSKICCSTLNDGTFLIGNPQTYDCLLESDNKHAVMKAIREAYEACMKKPMKVEIQEEFKYKPSKTKVKNLKYVKNDQIKVTMIEATPDGLVISIKPSDDAFDGKKLRRKNSIHKKFYGDYIHLQNSDWFKQMQADFNDQVVCFSSVVSKYNKNYKKQERILVVSDRAIYNLDPAGYIMKRRIELHRLKGISVSPLTDGFFILRIPDEYDYLLESSKKTEILKVLQENYTNATRSTLNCEIKEKISYKADKKSQENQTLKFRTEKNVTQTSIMPRKYGADVIVKLEETINNDMEREVVSDIYQGQKLRRRESLLSSNLGDYLHIASSKSFQKICQKHNETKLLYSGAVNKINHRYQVQDRKIIITENALYNMDKEASTVKRKIPLKKIAGISVSTMRDGFFIVRVPDEYDYFFESPNKTEIIKTLVEQYKKLTGKNLDLQIDDKQFYSAFKVSKGKGVRTIDFQEDNSIMQSTLYPTPTGLCIKINNKEEVVDEVIRQKLDEVVADEGDIYGGKKVRRKESASRERLGNYILDVNNPDLQKLFKQNGDKTLMFSSEISKINKKFSQQKRIMIVTDKNVYNLDPKDFKVKRKINLDEIDGVSVSTLPDGIFCMHMPESYDYVFDSDKKTEIIDVLSTAVKQRAQKKLAINVADKFEFAPSKGEYQSVSFCLDDSAGQTSIEAANNGLVVHVQHDEPSVTLEAAYVYYNDNQTNPIEVKPQPILIKFKKRWKYKLEIRFYVNEFLQGCSFHEKIDTVTSRQEFVSQVADLKPRDERYIVTLPERRVLFSLLSKTQVKAKLVDPTGKTLLAIRFVYDVR